MCYFQQLLLLRAIVLPCPCFLPPPSTPHSTPTLCQRSQKKKKRKSPFISVFYFPTFLREGACSWFCKTNLCMPKGISYVWTLTKLPIPPQMVRTTGFCRRKFYFPFMAYKASWDLACCSRLISCDPASHTQIPTHSRLSTSVHMNALIFHDTQFACAFPCSCDGYCSVNTGHLAPDFSQSSLSLPSSIWYHSWPLIGTHICNTWVRSEWTDLILNFTIITTCPHLLQTCSLQ